MVGPSQSPRRRYFATAAKGVETLLATELEAILSGRDWSAPGIGRTRGGVSFEGPLEAGYRVCLWSRLAQRVILRLATIALPARDPEALWRGLAEIDWTVHIPSRGTLAVDFGGRGAGVGVDNSLFGAQRVKDVIVDQLRQRSGVRPSVDLRRPDVRVNVYVARGEATVGIDLSGESLHRRGYRAPGEQAEAPLKETLAAAVLLRAGWPEVAAEGGSVLDPLCGSGTLPIEAALMVADVAPGLLRGPGDGRPDGRPTAEQSRYPAARRADHRWGFAGWLGHDEELWRRLCAEAGERPEAARAPHPAPRPVPPAVRVDSEARGVALARDDVARAGLDELVSVDQADLAALRRPAGLAADAPAGLVVANPPYGRRLGAGPVAAGHTTRPAARASFAASPATGAPTRAAGVTRRAPKDATRTPMATSQSAAPAPDPALAALYSTLGESLLSTFPGWRAAVLVADLDLGKHLGLKARRANRFMNGPLPVTLLRFELDERALWRPSEGGRAAPTAAAAGATTSQDIGRVPPSLSPAAEQFANRLRRNARHWGRVMRRAGVTCYRVYDADLPDYAVAIDRYERWVHVQEYAAPPRIDPAKARARLDEALRVIPQVLEVAPDDVFLKVRERQRGAAQYQRRAALGVEHEVHEGDLAFLVNFTDYLDTGLFLASRNVRKLVGDLAKGQAFLNLFGYTGTASVAAGRGGAARTTTVDLSARYLEWAGRNLALNKLRPARNELVEADVLRWVAETEDQWGLIYLDPPTFSNSKRMGRATFDVRRDHADLIRLVARRLLAPGGVLLFACNARRFAMDVEALSGDLLLEDLSRATLPPDFARSARSHHVWRIAARL